MLSFIENEKGHIGSFVFSKQYRLNFMIFEFLKRTKKNKNKKTCQILDFTVLADHRVKIKESKKRDKYLDHAWELKKNFGTKVAVILTLVSAQKICKRCWRFGIKNRLGETIQITALRLTRILRRDLVIWGDWCHSNSSEQLSTNACVKNSQKE